MNKSYRYTGWMTGLRNLSSIILILCLVYLTVSPLFWAITLGWSDQLFSTISPSLVDGVLIYIITPVLCALNLMALNSQFANIEIRDGRFRLITWINREKWYPLNEIETIHTASLKTGHCYVITKQRLPFNFQLVSFLLAQKRPGFFISEQIQDCDELKEILSQQQA